MMPGQTQPQGKRDQMIQQTLGRWSSHPKFADSNALFWKVAGIITFAVLVIIPGLVYMYFFWDSIMAIATTPISHLKGFLAWIAISAVMITTFVLTALLNNRLADHDGSAGSTGVFARWSVGLSGGILIVLGVAFAVFLWVILSLGDASGKFGKVLTAGICLGALPIAMQLLGNRNDQRPTWTKLLTIGLPIIFTTGTLIPITNTMLQGLGWVQNLFSKFQIKKEFEFWFVFVGVALIMMLVFSGAEIIWSLIGRFKPRINKDAEGSEKDEEENAIPPGILAAFPPIKAIISSTSESVIAKINPTLIPAVNNKDLASPSNEDSKLETAEESEEEEIEEPETLSSQVSSWVITVASDLNIAVAPKALEPCLPKPSDRFSNFVERSNIRWFFEGPPTTLQSAALEAIVNLGRIDGSDATAKDGDILIEGDEGSGRSTLLVAAALEIVLARGTDVLIIVPDPSRAVAMLDELNRRIEVNAAKFFMTAGLLLPDTIMKCMGNEDAVSPLPRILVGTLDQVEKYLIGSPAPKATIRTILARRQAILVDDLVEMRVQHRAHLPFVLDKLRFLMELENVTTQVVAVVPRLTESARITLGKRLLNTKGRPNTVTLFPIRESFNVISVNPTHSGTGSISIDETATQIAQGVVQKAINSGLKVAVFLKNKSENDISVFKSGLAAEGGTDLKAKEMAKRALDAVFIGNSLDRMRVSREWLSSWTVLRRRIAASNVVVVLRSQSKDELPLVLVFEKVDSKLKQELQVVPVMPSAKSPTYLVRHLASISRFIEPLVPVSRDRLSRLGFESAGDLRSLPMKPILAKFQINLQLLLDPSELDSNAIHLLDKVFWPWVALAGLDQQSMDQPHPVDFNEPPSFEEGIELDETGIEMKFGKNISEPFDATNGTKIANVLDDAGSHRLKWKNDQGRELGTTDLAFGDDLWLQTPDGTFFPMRIDARDKESPVIRVTGQPSEGSSGIACGPLWRATIDIPNAQTDGGIIECLKRQLGGPLSGQIVRFDLESGAEKFSPIAEGLDQAIRRRRRSRNKITRKFPSLDLSLLGALDTNGNTARIGDKIEFRHEVHGVIWIVASEGIDAHTNRDEKIKSLESAAHKSLGGKWRTFNDQKEQEEITNPWCGAVWPELSAAMQYALVLALPGWEYFGKIVVFHPSQEAKDKGAEAIIFFLEPMPTVDTVSDVINQIALDPTILRYIFNILKKLLEQTQSQPTQLGIVAKSIWEQMPAKGENWNEAMKLVDRLLNKIKS